MRIFSSNPPFFVCFYNPHPLNPFIARLIRKKYPEAILSLYLHDPYKTDKKSYGILKATYITLVEFIQGLTVKYMDYVISPSEYSAQLFMNKYPTFKGRNYIAPLLIQDQKISGNREPKYFSLPGAAHNATGHDTFIELVNFVLKKGLNYKFALISSSNISRYLEKLSKQAQKNLKVINKKIITDSEIDQIIRESYAVFRFDREVTQSGVIPVSYMNSIPVIIRNIPGLIQHVKHAENGYIVPFNCTSEDIIQAMTFVKENYFKLSEGARKSYEEIWAEWNWDKYYQWLIDLLKKT